jgi:hypothetical protein
MLIASYSPNPEHRWWAPLQTAKGVPGPLDEKRTLGARLAFVR